MVHILLMILKIIVSLLLVILGLLLAVVLAVLLVPVRYQAKGSWHGELRLALTVTWFLHLLSVRALYAKDGLDLAVKILGIPLFKKHDKDAAKDAAEETREAAQDLLGDSEQTLYDELEEDEARYRQAAEEKASGKKVSGKSTSGKKVSGKNTSGNKASGKSTSGNKASGQETSGNKADVEGEAGTDRGAKSDPEHKVKAFLEKVKTSFTNLRDKAKGTQELVQDKKAWLEDGKNQASLKLLFRQIKRLIAHIWPSKGKGDITFGFDDPYTTGQVLQVVSLIYPFYHRQLSVTPVFGETVLDGEGSFQGRIRLAYPLWLAFQVFIDTHTRRMIRGFIK